MLLLFFVFFVALWHRLRGIGWLLGHFTAVLPCGPFCSSIPSAYNNNDRNNLANGGIGGFEGQCLKNWLRKNSIIMYVMLTKIFKAQVSTVAPRRTMIRGSRFFHELPVIIQQFNEAPREYGKGGRDFYVAIPYLFMVSK